MYILNYHDQLSHTREMITLRKDPETCEVYYHDPVTGDLWKSFYPKGYKDEKEAKLLRKEPLPESLETQIDLCLSSADLYDAIGLGIEWSVQPGKWAEILHLLNKNRKRYTRKSVLTFLNHLGVLDPDNSLRDISPDLSAFNVDQHDLKVIKSLAQKIKWKKFFLL